MILVSVGDEVISPVALEAFSDIGAGAVASFTGIVRADGNVTAIELEHYPAMTQASLEALAREAMDRWQLLGCLVTHRIGKILVGEPVVLIGTAALHRTEALEACSFLIDRLKTEAPFWKKEHFADGRPRWVTAKAGDEARSSRWT